jgi:hypothetical protein
MYKFGCFSCFGFPHAGTDSNFTLPSLIPPSIDYWSAEIGDVCNFLLLYDGRHVKNTFHGSLTINVLSMMDSGLHAYHVYQQWPHFYLETKLWNGGWYKCVCSTEHPPQEILAAAAEKRPRQTRNSFYRIYGLLLVGSMSTELCLPMSNLFTGVSLSNSVPSRWASMLHQLLC